MTVSKIVKKHGNNRENLLQILHDIQDAATDRCLHRDALEELSELMNISVADLVGTATFYSMFSLKPRGRHIVRLCESPPCYILGSENILEALRDRLNIGIGETTPDGLFTLEHTSCLGACGVAPVMSIDDEVYGNLTAEKVNKIIDKIVENQIAAAAAAAASDGKKNGKRAH